METSWLLNISCYLLQTQLSLTILANSFIYNLLSNVVHTGSESLQDRLGDMQTCRMTLASAYMLHCLSATWSQLQIKGRSPR